MKYFSDHGTRISPMDSDGKPVNIYKQNPLGIGSDGMAYRAVIVDDSKMARQILKQILLSVEFVVTDEIDNGGTAVSMLKNPNYKIDYLFIDVEMPIMDGISVVKEIRAALPKCKIIMVTSHSGRDKIEELIKLGINGYVKKPFDRDTVIEKISQIQRFGK
jgi:DNA-binding NarL/FixJ family response regulator